MTDLTREQIEALLDGSINDHLDYDHDTGEVYLLHQGVIAESVQPCDGPLLAAAPRLALQLLATMTERDTLRAQLAEAQKREAGLIASLTEVKEELLWNAFHAGHEQSGFWDHCCMSDGEWLVRECGFDIAQRVYSAQSIRDRIPEAAKRAALSAAPTGEESNG